MTLVEVLQERGARERVIADGVAVVEEEVAARPGLSGMALRAGYKAFLKLRPGITRGGIVRLLPLMAPILDRQWADAVASGAPERWFRERAPQVADELLGVTDQLASKSKNVVLVRLYQSLRGSAKEHVAAGVPRIPVLLRKHLVAGSP